MITPLKSDKERKGKLPEVKDIAVFYQMGRQHRAEDRSPRLWSPIASCVNLGK